MSIVVSIDPGVESTGVALWQDNQLIRAELARGKTWQLTAHSAATLVRGIAIDIIVLERPQVYREDKLKGDPNDLVTLALVAGVIAGETRGAHIVDVLPRTWKGQLPKDVCQRRVEGRLSPRELRCVELPKRAKSLAHNVWDAIGVGLWHLGRFK